MVGSLNVWFLHFQIPVTCLAAAGPPHSTKTPLPRVLEILGIFVFSPFCHCHLYFTVWHFLPYFATDYFSLMSGSRPSSPGPSPTPSVAGSVTSSSSSARHRRPLISPARLNISGRKLRLFAAEPEPSLMSPSVSSSHFHVKSPSSVYSGHFSPDVSPFQSQNGEYSRGYAGGNVLPLYGETCWDLFIHGFVAWLHRFEFLFEGRQCDWRGGAARQLLGVFRVPRWDDYTGTREHPPSQR